MAYKVSNTGNGDGSYTLSYGSRGKKLTARMGRSTAGRWGVDGFGQMHTTMKDCKAAWGAWAEEAFDQPVGTLVTTTDPPPVPSPPAFAPPTFAPPAPEEPDPAPFDVYAADPFDPRFRAADKAGTPLGVVLQVRTWFRDNARLLDNVLGKALTIRGVDCNLFDEVRDALENCLMRECPDLFPGCKETTDDQGEETITEPDPAGTPPKFAAPEVYEPIPFTGR